MNEQMSPRPATSSAAVWTGRALWANLIGQVVIVLTGGAVRLTGSGLGCSTWPQCEPGSFTPELHQASSIHPFIEFGNRTVSGLLALVALAVAVLLWRRRDRARSLRWLGLVPLLGVVVQAVVGGISVRVELNPAVVGGHLLVSMLLIWVSTVLVIRYGEGDGPPVAVVSTGVVLLGRAVGVVLVPVLAQGMLTTGSGPHSGDDDAAYRFALDPVVIAKVHALSVWVFLALVIALAVRLLRRPAPRRPRRTAVILLVVTLAQGLVGYVQYFTGLPALLVGVHMLGASLLTATTAWTVLSLRERR